MKTRYGINLMVPNQNDKETLFNQSVNIIDSFINFYAQKIVTQIPTSLKAGEKYIVSGADGKGKISYCLIGSNRVETIDAPEGIICFVKEENHFYISENKVWKKLNISASGDAPATNNVASSVTTKLASDIVVQSEKFFGIDKKYELPVDAKNLYLYMNNDCELNFEKIQTREFVVIIKQNWQRTFNLIWPHNVLWADKQTHKLTQQANAVDIVRFYRLIETQHFIAEVIGQNYQF